MTPFAQASGNAPDHTSPATSSSAAPPATETGWPIKRIIALVILVGLGIAAQLDDVLNDRSVSNVISLIMAALATLILLSLVYRWVGKVATAGIAALVVLLAIAAPATMLRFKGFSGEMIPIFESRFRSGGELQEKPDDGAVTSQATVEATRPFPQFLGPDRNGVIADRDFAIPDQTQKELWRISVGQGWGGIAVQGQYCVTLEQRDAQECVACYRLSDGVLLWLHQSPTRHSNPLGGVGPRSTPTIAGEFVYTQGATGLVHCLKLQSGEVVWQHDLLELADWDQSASEGVISWGRAGSPLLVDGLCVLPFGRAKGAPSSSDALDGRSLIAFDAATGDVKWTAGEDQISYASPMALTLSGTKQIVSVNEKTVTGHSISDGQLLWALPWDGQSNGAANCSSVVPGGDNQILVAKGYGVGSGLFEIKEEQGQWDFEEIWASHRVLKTKFTHACVDGNFAYGLSDGTLECIDLESGKRLWAQPRGTRYEHGQVIRVGDCLVVQAENGTVAFVAATPEEFTVLASLPALNDKTWNVPSIAGRYLAVRNDAEAVVYHLPAK
jgi:outer membrane protein assembly factor BamB